MDSARCLLNEKWGDALKIVNIETKRLITPLNKTFKTSKRATDIAEAVIVQLRCDNGQIGYGSAAATPVITGETLASIEAAINELMAPQLINEEISQRERIEAKLNRVIIHNTSARAAVNIAIYDCLAKEAGLPLYKLLGGFTHQLTTDYTVSVNAVDDMCADANKYVSNGFRTLKIKVGSGSIAEDLRRVSAIRQQVGRSIKLCLDANQGWTAKEAIAVITKMEDADLDIAFVEQPVAYWDFDGMKQVTAHVATPIMADESIFNARDAARLLAMHGCDMVNIKLMKTGGLDEATKINAIAESYGAPCMIGCMIESSVSLAAAIHFAAAHANIAYCDLDAALMFRSDPVCSDISYQKDQILLSSIPGLGIKKIHFDAI